MDKLSGKSFDRPQYKKLVKKLKQGDIEQIDEMIWSISDLRWHDDEPPISRVEYCDNIVLR